MQPLFANSAWVAAPEALLLKGGGWRRIRLRVRYGLVRHPVIGPVLIDTGYTAHSLAAPGRSLPLRAYGQLLRPQMNAAEQPEVFLARHGLGPADIACVILTHFHADHVSGLRLFPKARFIASAAAWRGIKQNRAWANLRHGVFPELLPADFEARLSPLEQMPAAKAAALPVGFSEAGDLFGDGSVLAVALPGHAAGQFGLYFPQLDPPLLYAVDAQWLLAALIPGRSPGGAAGWIADDPTALGSTAAALRRFQAAGGELMLCHDPAATRYDLPSSEAGA
ncbi:MBL fold metallo-hydrolase [Phaeobacter sp. HF9A]|uniref:MBL fold metallo-hydrolase n=1 Tax=Phaeobacter sp. HF9A TaxID=2721561 RepID=UPI001431C4CF|nr:MBL fold metallo-hydrolase [Phaeobacter sp. HF9A]NIZ12520.1 MBL fold metallo-hydrolase [Phaeobacter sp. HF9A]